MCLGRKITASSKALKKLRIGEASLSTERQQEPSSNRQEHGLIAHNNVSFVLKKAGFGRGRGKPTMYYVREREKDKNLLVLGQSSKKSHQLSLFN